MSDITITVIGIAFFLILILMTAFEHRKEVFKKIWKALGHLPHFSRDAWRFIKVILVIIIVIGLLVFLQYR